MLTFADLTRAPSSADLRGFRWIVSIGGLVVSLLLYFLRHQHGAALAFACGGVALALLSLLPRLGRPLFIVWMGLGLVLGRVTTPILFGAVWLLLFTPMSVVFRLLGRDALKRRFPASETTFWEPHAPNRDARRYFQQF